MSLLAFPTMFKPREMHFFPKVTLHLIWSFVARQKTPSRGDVKHMNKMLTHDLLGHHFCQCPFHGCSTIKTTTPPMIPCYASAGAHKNTFNWVTPSSNWFKSSNWFHCHNRFRVWYFETDLHNSLLVELFTLVMEQVWTVCEPVCLLEIMFCCWSVTVLPFGSPVCHHNVSLCEMFILCTHNLTIGRVEAVIGECFPQWRG